MTLLIEQRGPGKPLRVVIVARISTVNQDPTALLAQIELCKQYIRTHFKGSFEFIIIASQGSGEILDRKELLELEDLIVNRKVEIVIAEDLGRIMRRMQAYMLCETCGDHGVRLIAVNDRIDTGDGDWQLATIFAAMKHERSNADTSARIARQLDYNFLQGACIIHLPPGIIRPEGSKSDTDLKWDPRYAQYFRCVFFWYERGWSICRLVRFLRSKGLIINNKQLRRLLGNPIFMGERRRGMTVMHRVNRSGRRVRRLAEPSHVKVRPVPHLAIINPKRFARVQATLKARGEKYVVGRDGRPDYRKGRPRKQSSFPGQRVQCAVCGRVFYWGGHGQAEHMSCSGERQYQCWLTATFDGHDARRRICAAVVEQLSTIEPFDPLLRQTIGEEAGRCLDDRMQQRDRLARQLGQHQREADNLLAAVRAGGGKVELLVEELTKAQASIVSTKQEMDELDRAPKPTVTLPSTAELAQLLITTMDRILADPNRVGAEIDRLLPSILVYPVRCVDGGTVVLRARVEVNLAALITVDPELAERLPILKRVVIVDFFDPPERVRIRAAVVKALAENPGMTLKWVAANITCCTATAVQRAMKLHRAMTDRGLSDPYVLITDAAQMAGRHRKHTRDRFKFGPLPGFPKLPNPDQDDRTAA